MEGYLNISFPFTSYKQVFVEESYSKMWSTPTLSIFSTHLLYDSTIIDQVYETRYIQAYALAFQWLNHFIGYKSWSDIWIVYGISGYLADLFFKKTLGNNEYRFRLMKVI